MKEDLIRFRDHCFQFACDKLDPEETAWMQSMLLLHPEWQQQVDEEKELIRLAREGMSQYRQPLVSFETIQAALQAQVQPTPSWWQRIVSTPASNMSRWAVAAVVVLGVATIVKMPVLISDEGSAGDGYRAAQVSDQALAGVLRVKFRDDVSLQTIRTQLDVLHMTVRHGPDAQGYYEVTVTEGTLQTAMQQLQAQGLVISVEIKHQSASADAK